MDKSHGSPFHATGKGLVDSQARIKPNERNATAVMVNNALSPSDKFYRHYLWITEITTGWTLSTTTGQGQRGRTIYPQHVGQNSIMVRGQLADQHQHDELVEFVTHHHNSIFDNTSKGFKGNGNTAISFTLYPYAYETGARNRRGQKIYKVHYEPWKYNVYIASIDAGHERFAFAPEYQMELVVADDLLQEPVEVQTGLMKALKINYKDNIVGGGVVTVDEAADAQVQRTEAVRRPPQQTNDVVIPGSILDIPSVFVDPVFFPGTETE